jgi:hypothetical protein
MNIQLEKQKIIKKIEKTNDLSSILEIKKILKSDKKDFWEELTEEQKEEINLSLQEFDEGKYSNFNDFILPYLKLEK